MVRVCYPPPRIRRKDVRTSLTMSSGSDVCAQLRWPSRARQDQNMRACGSGHQRSCTLPMMYFFGTKPQ
jgi:hypothetical protein